LKKRNRLRIQLIILGLLIITPFLLYQALNQGNELLFGLSFSVLVICMFAIILLG